MRTVVLRVLQTYVVTVLWPTIGASPIPRLVRLRARRSATTPSRFASSTAEPNAAGRRTETGTRIPGRAASWSLFIALSLGAPCEPHVSQRDWKRAYAKRSGPRPWAGRGPQIRGGAGQNSELQDRTRHEDRQ